MVEEKIYKIVKNANLINLEKITEKITDKDKIDKIKSMFENHMRDISIFCFENFYKKDLLEEKFIRELHKIHYPKGYKETQKTVSGDAEIITMIPGNFKTLNNFTWVEPKNVKDEITILINKYNNSEKNEDEIYYFLLDFLRIHPFGNGNARIISIIIDLMLLKINIEPIYFNYIQNKDKIKSNIIIEKAIKNNDVIELKNLIKNQS